jgi:protein TonB
MSIRRVVVLSLLLALLLVVLNVRRTAVDVFFHRPVPVADSASVAANGVAPPVIAIHIDPETDATGIIDVTPPPATPVPTDTATVRPERPQPDARPDLDLDDLLDRPAGPRAGAAPSGPAAVPPRPVEITWPETRRLKQCIGASVNVRIWVSEDGQVKDARVVPSGALPACADAALDAARHIRFEPGRQGGVAVTMWTEVRIDFQRRD